MYVWIAHVCRSLSDHKLVLDALEAELQVVVGAMWMYELSQDLLQEPSSTDPSLHAQGWDL